MNFVRRVLFNLVFCLTKRLFTTILSLTGTKTQSPDHIRTNIQTVEMEEKEKEREN